MNIHHVDNYFEISVLFLLTFGVFDARVCRANAVAAIAFCASGKCMRLLNEREKSAMRWSWIIMIFYLLSFCKNLNCILLSLSHTHAHAHTHTRTLSYTHTMHRPPTRTFPLTTTWTVRKCALALSRHVGMKNTSTT